MVIALFGLVFYQNLFLTTMKFRAYILKMHRVLGALVSVLFVCWFLSAFVMIYHGYPRYDAEEAARLSSRITHFSLSDSLVHRINQIASDSLSGKATQLSIERRDNGDMCMALRGKEKSILLTPEGKLFTPATPSLLDCQNIAHKWGGELLSIDTITTLDQWTPFSRLRGDLPFYRLNLSEEGRQVYLSSVDGRIITEHTKAERLWACFGAIPHWVYFTWLRQNADLWSNLIIFLAALGTLMTLAGIYIGIDVLKRTKKSPKGMHSPYKKPAYKLHHIMGTLGGVFILSWVFSGLMSLASVPESVNLSPKQSAREVFAEGQLRLEAYRAEHITALLSQSDMRSLRLTSLGEHPIIKATDAEGKATCYDAKSEPLQVLTYTETELAQYISRIYGETKWSAERLTEYDGYYLSRDNKLPLPVWRIKIDADDAPYIYLNEQSGSARVFTRRDRIQAWLYNKPHSLKFAWLTDKPLLWSIVMWALLIIGTITSVTGLILGIRYFRRSLRSGKKG